MNGTMRHVTVVAAVLLPLAVGAAEPRSEADRFWGQWRGPRMDGVAREGNPPLEWSETKNVRWKIALPGLGSSTPVIWKDRLYVLAAIPVGADAVPPPPVAPAGAGPGGRPGGGRAAAEPPAAQEFTLFAINRSDGGVAWKRRA
jgi:hypothetical protein